MLYYAKPGEGRVLVDVGANIGKHALRFAKLSREGLVITIEPHPDNFRALYESVRVNNLRNIVLINATAWDKEGLTKLFAHGWSDVHSVKTRQMSFY